MWSRLSGSLARTRRQIAGGIGDLILGARVIDEEVLEELETSLLVADVGVEATDRIMDNIKRRVSRRELADTRALHGALRAELIDIVAPVAEPFAVGTDRPHVVLVVGVNGAGKTTSIGKLAKRLKADGHSLLLAAGDTFRAAAVEQLSAWGEREKVPVIAQGQGADAASVIFDAVNAAKARGIDVVLADTAGRLQAKTALMEELAKIKRVMARLGDGAPHEVLLVLDAGVGQNALSQVAEFDRAVGLTGLAVTKLDGTAKAGVLFAIAARHSLPVKFIGIGEGVLTTCSRSSQSRSLMRSWRRKKRSSSPLGSIEFEHVSRRFDNGAEGLHDVSVSFAEGSMAFITGHSGAGKSTFLKLLLAIDAPTRGQDSGQRRRCRSPAPPPPAAVSPAIGRGVPRTTACSPVAACSRTWRCPCASPGCASETSPDGFGLRCRASLFSTR